MAFQGLYAKIKRIILFEFSLFNLFYSLVGVNYSHVTVSNTNVIYCKSFTPYHDGYFVETLNNEVILPFDGIVTKKVSNSISIDVGSNIIFTIEKIKPKLYLYYKIDSKTVIANNESYYIYANENNISYLNYKVKYEVI